MRRRNPLSPKAYAYERQPCALMRPYGIAPDDRSGVHFATNWGLAARYALFKAAKSDSIGVVLEYDLSGLELVPDHDATIEKEHGDCMVGDVNYYIDEFDILADPDSPDYDRLADLMEREQEMFEPPSEEPPYTIEGTLINNSKHSIFGILAERLRDYRTADQALMAIQAADIPLEWWAESIAQVRTFAEVGEERLLRVMVLRPVEDELHDEYSDDDDEDACPAPLYIDDLDMIEDTLQRMSVTLWERPDARSVREVHYHGTDLTRAAFILQDSPAGAALHNPWHPCVQP